MPRSVCPGSRQPRERARQALAVEGVRRGVPRRQLGRVQVPALVVAALERAAHQPVVVAPSARRPSSASPTGQHVGGAVGEPDAGARRGRLHDQLGVVGDRVLQRLVAPRRSRRTPSSRRCRSAARSPAPPPACTIRATSAVPSGPRIDCGVSTCTSNRRSRQSSAHVHHRLDLVDAGDLGQRHHPAVEDPARGSSSVATYDVSVRSAAGPGRRLEALEPDPAERRRLARAAGSRASAVAARHHVGVLVGVAPADVAVLEVDPQVLDRLGGELGPHPRHQVVVGHQLRERRRVLVERRQRGRAVRRRPGPRRTGPRGRRPCAPAAARAARRGSRAPAPRPPRPAVRRALRSAGSRARPGRSSRHPTTRRLPTRPSQNARPSLRFAVRPSHPSGDGSAFSEWRNK